MDFELMIENLISLRYFYPEIILSATIILVILFDLARRKLTTFIPILGLIATFVSAIELYSLDISRSLFTGMVVVDNYSMFFKFLFIITAIVIVWLSIDSRELSTRPKGEYFALILSTTLGMMLMASSTDLLMAYLSLEFVSITSYVLAGYLKFNRRSSEAALKYIIYGAVSSGIMIYGMSILYGLTGETNIYKIKDALMWQSDNGFAIFTAVIFILAGFGYKIASVPFHFWAPDVYEGAPIPVTAFFSVGPKAAGYALLGRFFYVALSSQTGQYQWTAVANLDWSILLAWISVATMTLGNLVAIVQNNVKRLLAYSSIAHAGYILMGVVVMNQEGIFAVLFYLIAYMLMNIGAFAVVLIISNKLGVENVSDYKGLGKRMPLVCVTMTVFLFSLAGIPPTIGFIGKFYLFIALINSAWYWLAIAGVLNSVVSLYYYARIFKAMFLEESPETSPVPVTLNYSTLILVLAIPTVIFGLYFEPLYKFAIESVKFFVG
jgi:NADH-quinone oxidoreductase subunit N